MTNNQSHILVSICCITYNHVPFIGKAIEGFLMQEPPTGVSADEPWYEILIHDDASTDGTTEIIKEYAAKYPDKIFPLYETVNQYTNGHRGDIDFFNYRRARGKYIAYCEGDDFWTIPDKLKRQIDFMESHPDYSVCWHLSQIYEVETGKYRPVSELDGVEKPQDEDITTTIFMQRHCGQPLTMVFRRELYDFEWQKHYTNYCDSMENFHLLQKGKGRRMKFLGGQYNLTDHGVSAAISNFNRTQESCVDYMEMYVYTKDKDVYAFWEKTMLYFYSLCISDKRYKDGISITCKAIKQSPVKGLYFGMSFVKQIVKSIIKKS